jgi:hypothetical protein
MPPMTNRPKWGGRLYAPLRDLIIVASDEFGALTEQIAECWPDLRTSLEAMWAIERALAGHLPASWSGKSQTVEPINPGAEFVGYGFDRRPADA